jgi:hypothetical protein
MRSNNAFERTGEERGQQRRARKMMRTATAIAAWPAINRIVRHHARDLES